MNHTSFWFTYRTIYRRADFLKTQMDVLVFAGARERPTERHRTAILPERAAYEQ